MWPEPDKMYSTGAGSGHTNGLSYVLLKNLYLSAYFPQGLSFLALILISTKLYDISKEINFLSHVSFNWLNLDTLKDTFEEEDKYSELKEDIVFQVDSLRDEIDSILKEILSTRTTLVLSLVLVLIYIVSWGWMAYAVSDPRNVKGVSLKTILCLAVFASIDITASTGFVLVRMIMFFVRDNNFPFDMEKPSLLTQSDQLTAFLGLRFAVIKSSPGNIDIFVSILIGFLTGLRVYSVICACTFYQKVKKGVLSNGWPTNNFSVLSAKDLNKEKTLTRHGEEIYRIPEPFVEKYQYSNGHYMSNGEKYHYAESQGKYHCPSRLQNNYNQVSVNVSRNPSISKGSRKQGSHYQEGHYKQGYSTIQRNKFGYVTSDSKSVKSVKEGRISRASRAEEQRVVAALEARDRDLERNCSVTGTSTISDEEEIVTDVKIHAADMPLHMQRAALASATEAVRIYNTEKHVAESIKQDFDDAFDPTWHCIVGKNWGSCVTHSKKCYIRMIYKEMTILLYK